MYLDVTKLKQMWLLLMNGILTWMILIPPVNLTNRDTSNVERERKEQSNSVSRYCSRKCV